LVPSTSQHLVVCDVFPQKLKVVRKKPRKAIVRRELTTSFNVALEPRPSHNLGRTYFCSLDFAASSATKRTIQTVLNNPPSDAVKAAPKNGP